MPEPVERSTYVLFSSLALLLLFWQWRPIGGVVWSVESQAARWAIYGLYFFGWMLLLVSTFLIDHFELFGLQQVWRYLRGHRHAQGQHKPHQHEAGKGSGVTQGVQHGVGLWNRAV